MSASWRLRFSPGVWVGDDLSKVDAEGEDSWTLSAQQVKQAVEAARDGQHWDEVWVPADFDGAEPWVREWAKSAAVSGRQYDFVLVAPGGTEYREDDVRRGYADHDLRRDGLLG